LKEIMAKLLKEISVITGKYTNAQGQEKNRYTRIGSIIDTKNGEMLKIDVTPLMDGGWNGWAYINDPKPKDDGFPKDDNIEF
tara:strand:- start:214 stop:459 length:246 start_codon:yes stop_codon:yes gene_type:complete